MLILLSEFLLLQKIGPSEEIICSYLFLHPLKLWTFAPSTCGLRCLEWPRGITKATKSRCSRHRMLTLMWVVQNQLWIQADCVFIACFWPGLLYTWSQHAAFSGHKLFQVGSWGSTLLNSVPVLGETLGLMLEFSLAPRSEHILLALLWHELVSSLKSTFP